MTTPVIAKQVFRIDGMNCEHCVAAITAEVSKLPGFINIDVELATGLATLDGADMDSALVIAAIDEAGFSASTVC